MVETLAEPLTEAHGILQAAESEGRSVLFEHEVYAPLTEAGIETRPRFVRSRDEVDAALLGGLAADELVVKLVSPDVAHRSDVRGVAFCRGRVAETREAAARVLAAARRRAPGADRRGVLLAERVRFRAGFGLELLSGFRHDPVFGAVVVLGLGGLDAEFLLSSLRPVFSVDAGERYDAAVRLMRREGLPCFRRIDRAVRALAAFVSATSPPS